MTERQTEKRDIETNTPADTQDNRRTDLPKHIHTKKREHIWLYSEWNSLNKVIKVKNKSWKRSLRQKLLFEKMSGKKCQK